MNVADHLQSITLTVVVVVNPRVTGIPSLLGDEHRYVFLHVFALSKSRFSFLLQAKGGFKTRPKNNINKWVVVPRVRNHGKRRSKNS